MKYRTAHYIAVSVWTAAGVLGIISALGVIGSTYAFLTSYADRTSALTCMLDVRLEAIEQAVLLNASAVSLAGRAAFAETKPKDSPAKTVAWQSFDIKAGGSRATVYAVGTNDVSILKQAK